MEVSSQLHAVAIYSKKEPLHPYPLDRKLGGPKKWCGCGSKEKNSLPLQPIA
jgi:hypothetical protein